MTKHIAILPIGSSQLEKCAAEICAQAQDLNVDLSILWNPEKCPVNLLPFLAWALSVDYWEESWEEDKKREVIKSAFYIHRQKGTISSLKRVIEPFGFLLELKEWFEENANVGTFRLSIEIPPDGINKNLATELSRLIDNTKPVSRHLSQLAITYTNIAAINTFSMIASGNVVTIYPE